MEIMGVVDNFATIMMYILIGMAAMAFILAAVFAIWGAIESVRHPEPPKRSNKKFWKGKYK